MAVEKRARSPERAPDPVDLEDEDLDASEREAHPNSDQPDPPEPNAPDADDEAQRKIEQRARRMGWVPQAEFRGDPAKWVSAEEFVENGLGNNKILVERLGSLESKLDKSEAENREIKTRLEESGQVLKAINDRFVNADRAGYERGRREAKARMREAAANADTEAFDAAEADLAAYDANPLPAAPARADAPAHTEPARPTVDPITSSWVAENAWFKDDELSDHAIRIHRRLVAQTPYYKTPEGQRAGLDAVTAEIKRRYPEWFENPRRTAAGTTRGPSGDRAGNRGTRGRSYADLPADAKKECDKFVRTIPGYTREKYCAIYEWDA